MSTRNLFSTAHTNCTLALLYEPLGAIRSKLALVCVWWPLIKIHVIGTPDKAQRPCWFSSICRQSSRVRTPCRPFWVHSRPKYLPQLPLISLYCAGVLSLPQNRAYFRLQVTLQNFCAPDFGGKIVLHSLHGLCTQSALSWCHPAILQKYARYHRMSSLKQGIVGYLSAPVFVLFHWKV